MPTTSLGVIDVEVTVPSTNPSFTKITWDRRRELRRSVQHSESEPKFTWDSVSSFTLSVDSSKAIPGGNIVNLITALTQPNGIVDERTLEFNVVVFASNLIKTAKTSLSEDPSLDESVKVDDINELDTKFVFCSENLTQDEIEFNAKIKKPFIYRVKPSGEFTLYFSEDRYKEGACRQLQEDDASEDL